jgi:FtsP/CotA-like multicopper oxidase with cupredoxin domain
MVKTAQTCARAGGGSPPRVQLPSSANIVSGQRYRYVHHCHILEHEDNEMMRPFDVIG